MSRKYYSSVKIILQLRYGTRVNKYKTYVDVSLAFSTPLTCYEVIKYGIGIEFTFVKDSMNLEGEVEIIHFATPKIPFRIRDC